MVYNDWGSTTFIIQQQVWYECHDHDPNPLSADQKHQSLSLVLYLLGHDTPCMGNRFKQTKQVTHSSVCMEKHLCMAGSHHQQKQLVDVHRVWLLG